MVEWFKTRSISGLKPISNILSASSKTKNLTDENVIKPLWTKSFRRPGVAVSMWIPLYINKKKV